ncbi:hypothetical protein RU639_008581 [Aspergillus parasiticus]
MRIGARLSRPALVLNSLWTNVPFTVVCITVFLVWGTLNASEQLTALYLQDVRGTSTLTASLYFMVAPVCGLLMNAAIGISLPYLKPSIAVPTGCLVSGIAPLLLATLCGVDGPGWEERGYRNIGTHCTGYKAGWWYNCGLGFVSVDVSFGGLGSVKRLEMKRD